MRGMSAQVKDIFLIHTKSSQFSRDLVEECSRVLQEAEYSVWAYRDWEWAPDEIAYHPPVTDIRAYACGDPDAFRHERPSDVDRKTLRRILENARVVAVILPEDGRLTSGVAEELRIARQAHSSHQGTLERPTLLCCTTHESAGVCDSVHGMAFADHVSLWNASNADRLGVWSPGQYLACRIARLRLLQVIAGMNASDDMELRIQIGTIENRLSTEIARAKTLCDCLDSIPRDERSALLAQIQAAESLAVFFSCLAHELYGL